MVPPVEGCVEVDGCNEVDDCVDVEGCVGVGSCVGAADELLRFVEGPVVSGLSAQLVAAKQMTAIAFSR